jgi:putative hydrolase of the HAD superfamily
MKNVKRIAAIIGIALIISMYVITLISSFLISKYTNALFLASLFSTLVVPVLIYAYLLIYKLVNKKEHTVFIDEAKKLGEKDLTGK